MLSNTQFSSLPTQISRNGKQQISLFLIAHKMRRLKELDAITDEAEILEEVLNYGLTKTPAILDDELPKILGLNLEEKASNG